MKFLTILFVAFINFSVSDSWPRPIKKPRLHRFRALSRNQMLIEMAEKANAGILEAIRESTGFTNHNTEWKNYFDGLRHIYIMGWRWAGQKTRLLYEFENYEERRMELEQEILDAITDIIEPRIRGYCIYFYKKIKTQLIQLLTKSNEAKRVHLAIAIRERCPYMMYDKEEDYGF